MVRVGDIVKTKAKEGNKILPAVVTRVIMRFGEDKVGWIDVLFSDGTYGNRAVGKFTETGRHIDILNVLSSIR